MTHQALLRSAAGPLLAAACLLSTACGPSSSTGGDDMAVGATGDMSRVRPDLARDMWMPHACVKGTVSDETGAAVTAVSVLGCSSEICLYGTSMVDGSFQICDLKLVNLAMKVEEDLTRSPRHAEAICPAKPTSDGQVLDIGKLIVPLLGPGANVVDMTATKPVTLAAGDGVQVTLTPKELVTAIGFKGTINIAARQVPASRRCGGFVVPDGGSIVASYALSPFGTTTRAGGDSSGSLTKSLGFTVPLETPVAAGAEVHFWSVTELDGQLEGPAKGHADQTGTTASTDAGEGLSELSWLIVSSK